MSKRHSQCSFEFSEFVRPKNTFGGSLLKGNPKGARPLDSKLPIHLVLRARKSCMRLPPVFGEVNDIVERVCRKHGVRLYKFANVGNHLHLLIKIRSRRSWAGFIRELTGQIAQTVLEFAGGDWEASRFWMFRPFTRVVRGWQKAFRYAKEYVELNILEAKGRIDRKQVANLRSLRNL